MLATTEMPSVPEVSLADPECCVPVTTIGKDLVPRTYMRSIRMAPHPRRGMRFENVCGQFESRVVTECLVGAIVPSHTCFGWQRELYHVEGTVNLSGRTATFKGLRNQQAIHRLSLALRLEGASSRVHMAVLSGSTGVAADVYQQWTLDNLPTKGVHGHLGHPDHVLLIRSHPAVKVISEGAHFLNGNIYDQEMTDGEWYVVSKDVFVRAVSSIRMKSGYYTKGPDGIWTVDPGVRAMKGYLENNLYPWVLGGFLSIDAPLEQNNSLRLVITAFEGDFALPEALQPASNDWTVTTRGSVVARMTWPGLCWDGEVEAAIGAFAERVFDLIGRTCV